MQQLPPGQAPGTARRQVPHALPRLRLSAASQPLLAGLAAAFLSGLLLFLANPPASLGPLAFVALVPFLWAVRRTRPLRGLLLGFAFGLAFFASTLYWIRLFGELGWGALSLASAAYPALFGLLAPIIWREHRPVRSAIGLGALWTGVEYLRALWPLGGFTWGGVGYTQVGNGFLLPLASVTGVWGISFVVVLVNAFLLRALERAAGGPRTVRAVSGGPEGPPAGERRGRRPLGPRARALGLVLVSAVLVLAPALIRIPEPGGHSIDVAIVQGNDIQGRLADPLLEDRIIAANHARLHHTLAGNPPDLVVWPENALDEDPTRVPYFRNLVRGAVRAVGAPTLVGAITEDRRGRQFNQGLLYDGTGHIVDRYTKVHLVPFGEFVPWRGALGWISALRQVPRDLTPGHSIDPLSVDGLRFGVLVCYENTFPSLDRRMVARGAEFLVVITNNASYERTAASEQHIDMSRLRAVENGRWVVHAAISGISAFIDPHGGVHQPTGLFQLGVIRQAIPAGQARTIYNRLGDYVPWVSLAGAVGLLFAPRRRRAVRPADPLPAEPRILVILPTYNERATVEDVVTRVLRAQPRADVLVVDDGSPDGTGEIVGRLARSEPRVRLLERARKGGLAGAYTAGFRVALDEGYDLVAEMDADLSHQPEQLPALVQGAGAHHLGIGSRYVPGGSVTNWGLLRRFLSRAGNAYARLMLGFPLTDSTSGFRVYRSSLLRHLLEGGVHSDGYAFQVELAYRAWRDGFSIGESPITFQEREHGRSKISRRIVLEALALVALWGLRDRFRALPEQLPPHEPPTRTDDDRSEGSSDAATAEIPAARRPRANRP